MANIVLRLSIFASLVGFAVWPLELAAKPPYPAELIGGWTIEREVYGDLNGDGNEEAVLVVNQADPVLVIENDALGGPTIDTNPRALLVLKNTSRGWRQILRTSTFVPSSGSLQAPCLIDPLAEGEIAVEDGKLFIQYNYWSSCGSYGVTTNRYTFRLQVSSGKERLRLIGFDKLEFSRASGTGNEVSINYLTSRRKRTSGLEVIARREGDPPVARPMVVWEKIRRETYFLEGMNISACEDWNNLPSWC